MDAAIEVRLKTGAILLGKYWKAGDRCSMGWSIRVLPISENEDAEKAIAQWACLCEKKSRFCKTKALWFTLAMMDLRQEVEAEYGIALMMTAAEWDSTGLTLKVEIGGKVVGIGQNGLTTMASLINLMKAPESLPSALQLMTAFPGAKIDSVEEPAKLKPPAELAAVVDAGAEEPFE